MDTGGLSAGDLLHWIWPPVLILLATWLWLKLRRRTTGFRKVLLAVGLMLTLLAGIGGTYASIGAAVDRRTYRPPGELVDVGDGRYLHLNCTGSGSPTVVLEALSGGVSPVWGRIQPAVARETKVCSYDRPGRGWSDPAGGAQDGEEIADQLKRLLEEGGAEGPYVLVGHSLGGLYARMFAARNAGDVAGMVLLDASHPDQFRRMPEEEEAYESFRSFQRTFSPMARLGIWRAYFDAGGSFDFGGLPDTERGQMKAIWSSPAFFRSQQLENDAVRDIHRQVRPLASLGDIPLLVISAGDQNEGWLQLQSEMSGLSTNGSQRIIEGATHVSLLFDERDAGQVSDGILEVVEVARRPR